MFELPEYLTLARQINATLVGKTIRQGTQGNSPHKFVWYNQTPQEFERLTHGKVVGGAKVQGRWLLINLEPGYRLVFGECGGKMRYHAPGTPLPEKYHLLLCFTDNSSLSLMTTMWGAMELHKAGKEQERQYIRGMRLTPVEKDFNSDYFSAMIDELLQGPKRSVKSLLTEDQLIPGLGNSIAQDILFRSHLNPRHSLSLLTLEQRSALFQATIDTLREIMEKGGRNDETDLFGHPGGYTRLMDSHTCGKPCPVCGEVIEKIQYLGGACYLCPHCQL